MSLEAFGDENPYTNGPMKECPDCEGYGKISDQSECGTCSGTGEVYDEYEPCEGDVL